MALFGSTKGSENWFKTREESAFNSLNRKLLKEIKRREGAEKEAKRWKEKYSKAKEELDKELERLGPYGDQSPSS